MVASCGKAIKGDDVVPSKESELEPDELGGLGDGGEYCSPVCGDVVLALNLDCPMGSGPVKKERHADGLAGLRGGGGGGCMDASPRSASGGGLLSNCAAESKGNRG